MQKDASKHRLFHLSSVLSNQQMHQNNHQPSYLSMTCQCLLAGPNRVPTRCVSKLSVGVSELREQPESGGLGVGGRLKGGGVQSGPGHTMQACQQSGAFLWKL
jgi:hypothetical protein